jgi:hypothetical protein
VSELNIWAENLTREVYDKWKNEYSFWKPGFKIFYTPIIKYPDLLILSLNPGGTEKDFEQENKNEFDNDNFSLPKKNEYLIANYLMAMKMRLLFRDRIYLLEQSVALPILFFRSKNYQYWKKNIPKNILNEMEQFSYSKLQTILIKLKPRFCLVIGFQTYEQIKNNILKIDDESQIFDGSHRLYIIAKSDNLSLFVIPHLTGYHLSIKKIDTIRNVFFNEFLN